MYTVWAVYTGEKDKYESDNSDWVCFYDTEKEAAIKFADSVNSEVEEWTMFWYDIRECNFRSALTLRLLLS